MSNAPNYTPTADFSQDESVNAAGRSTVNTTKLDAELANIATSVNGVNTNLQKIQRDDGKLTDYIVEPYNFSEKSRALLTGGWNPRGPWATAKDYAVRDMVNYGNMAYVCLADHKSTAWAADSGKWMSTTATGDSEAFAAQAAASAAQASADAAAATGAAAAAAGSATTASNAATSATTSANTATSAASSASTSASDAAGAAASAAESAGLAYACLGLSASSTGLSAAVTITADALAVISSGFSKIINNVNVSPSLAASGINGLDTGTSSANTWYYVYVIWNGTTTAGLFSLSSTTPALPSGYTHFRRVSAIRSDSTANKFPLSMIQFGDQCQYKLATGSNLTAQRVAASGMAGTVNSALVAVSLSAFVPSIAVAVMVGLYSSGSGAMQVHTNNSSPAILNSNMYQNVTSGNWLQSGGFLLESISLQWASNAATNSLIVFGFKIPV